MQTNRIARILVLPLLLAAQMTFAAGRASPQDGGALPILAERLPAKPLPCPLTGPAVSPAAAFTGRPGVLLFLDAGAEAPGDLERFLGRMQEEIAPWLTWGAVLSGGPGTGAGSLQRPGSGETVRLDHCWRDEDGSWGAALGVSRLPTAVLVSASGYVVARQVGLPAEEERGFRRALERLVAASRLPGLPVRDFKLAENDSGRLATFADLPLRDYTFLLSVASGCPACAAELSALTEVARLHPGRVTVVTIDHDRPGEAAPDGARPTGCDRALRDPARLYAERYALGGVPALIVADRGGTIVLARQGFEPGEGPALTDELLRLFDRPGGPDAGSSRFAEFLRVRAEALDLLDGGRAGMAAFFLERARELCPDFHTVLVPLAEAYRRAGRPREAARAYAGYLAAEPGAYDRPAILASLKLLAARP
jgi:thiol-disulfide isomerase/thioredoxin